MALSTSDLEAYGVSPEKSKEFLDKINAEMRASVPQPSATPGLSAEAEQRLRAEFQAKFDAQNAMIADLQYRRAVERELAEWGIRDVDMGLALLDRKKITINADGSASGTTKQLQALWNRAQARNITLFKDQEFAQQEGASAPAPAKKAAPASGGQRGAQLLNPAEPSQKIPRQVQKEDETAKMSPDEALNAEIDRVIALTKPRIK